MRSVVADDLVAEATGAVTDLRQAGNLEGHVVDAGTVAGQIAVQESVLPDGLEHLDATASSESPLAPAILAGRRAEIGLAAQDAAEEGPEVADAMGGHCDVVEADPGHDQVGAIALRVKSPGRA